jgi:hypothetical protein
MDWGRYQTGLRLVSERVLKATKDATFEAASARFLAKSPEPSGLANIFIIEAVQARRHKSWPA